MPDQVLDVVPNCELVFRGPFTTPRTSLLKLTNPTNELICFKMKTTAPQFYSVRPNSGELQPGESVDIAVTLRVRPDPNGKHKLMVQSVRAPHGDVDMGQLWMQVDPTQIMFTRLRCLFEYPASMQDYIMRIIIAIAAALVVLAFGKIVF